MSRRRTPSRPRSAARTTRLSREAKTNRDEKAITFRSSEREHFRGAFMRRHTNLVHRARIRQLVRKWFDDLLFLEVDTPQVVPSPGVETHLDAFEVRGADGPRWLITSPEYQMKRMLAGNPTNIYQLCHCFRRGELGHLHEPEFTMLEWYRPNVGMDQAIRDTESLVQSVAMALHQSTRIPGLNAIIDVDAPWERITVRDAFRRYAGVEADSLLQDETRFFETLVTEVEPKLGLTKPTVLYAYPAQMASLARLSPEDPTVAERFEVYVRGVELANGFGELTDPIEQRARCELDVAKRKGLGKEPYPIDERFLAALEQGIPPCSGVALGFDRLVMLLLGMPSIDEVIAFPQRHL